MKTQMHSISQKGMKEFTVSRTCQALGRKITVEWSKEAEPSVPTPAPCDCEYGRMHLRGCNDADKYASST